MQALANAASPAMDPGPTPGAYAGPERRSGGSPVWQWLAAMLDEIDYGMLLLDDQGQLLHVNHAARSQLDAGHPLCLVGRQLRARRACDQAPVRAALDAAVRRGLRKLLTVGEPGHEVGISVVPLGAIAGDGRSLTLAMLGKRRVCGELAVQAFARSHGLTPGETRVLLALCEGLGPAAAAAAQGVAISTVRTHIGSIRLKTGAGSIRSILGKVAALPPLMGVLRPGGSTGGSRASLETLAA